MVTVNLKENKRIITTTTKVWQYNTIKTKVMPVKVLGISTKGSHEIRKCNVFSTEKIENDESPEGTSSHLSYAFQERTYVN